MTPTTQKIAELKAELERQITAIRDEAIAGLRARQDVLVTEFAQIDDEIAQLSGAPAKHQKAARKTPAPAGKNPDLQELKAILAALPGKTLRIRREGYDLRNIQTLAKANSALLQMGPKSPWPTVTLLK